VDDVVGLGPVAPLVVADLGRQGVGEGRVVVAAVGDAHHDPGVLAHEADVPPEVVALAADVLEDDEVGAPALVVDVVLRADALVVVAGPGAREVVPVGREAEPLVGAAVVLGEVEGVRRRLEEAEVRVRGRGPDALDVAVRGVGADDEVVGLGRLRRGRRRRPVEQGELERHGSALEGERPGAVPVEVEGLGELRGQTIGSSPGS
jgi:hypothetical protein